MKSTKLPIIGYMAAYNEAEYIEPAVRSVIDHVDGLIVIEGPFKETVETGGAARSDDGTIEILERLQKEFQYKLYVVEAPAVPQLRHRGMVFDVVPFHFPIIANRDYWLWLVDADEVYASQDSEKLKEILNTTQSDVIKVDSLTFVNDFRHYVKIAFPRCFRIHSGYNYQFSGPNHLVFKPSAGGYRTWVSVVPEENHEDKVRFFHYSYVKSAARFTQKKKEREHVHGQFKWYLDEDGRVTAPGVNIRLFSGEHPEIMKSHTRYPEDVCPICKNMNSCKGQSWCITTGALIDGQGR